MIISLSTCYRTVQLNFSIPNVSIILTCSYIFQQNIRSKKGGWHEIFEFRFFPEPQFPLAPEYPIGAILDFFTKIRGNSQRHLQQNKFACTSKRTWVKIHSVNSNPAASQNNMKKTSYLKNFLIYHRCRWHRQLTFTIENLREFS